MKRKQMTPTVKLVLSIISLVIGLIWTSACVTVLFSMGSLTTLWRGVVLVLFSVLLFWLGIRGLLRWRAEKSRTDPKKVKIILAATGAAMVFIIFQLSLTLPATWASGRINSAPCIAPKIPVTRYLLRNICALVYPPSRKFRSAPLLKFALSIKITDVRVAPRDSAKNTANNLLNCSFSNGPSLRYSCVARNTLMQLSMRFQIVTAATSHRNR